MIGMVALAEVQANLEAVHMRHLHIQYHQVGWVGLHLGQRLAAVGRDARRIACVAHHFRHHGGELGLVIDDEDAGGHGLSALWSGPHPDPRRAMRA